MSPSRIAARSLSLFAALVALLALVVSSLVAVPGAAAFEPVMFDCDNPPNIPGVIDIGAGQVPTAASEIILGTPGDDIIAAGDGDDVICGFGGDDKIWGQNGNDQIYGGDGADRLRGSDGNDLLVGGDGDDDLNGGRDNDIVLADDGADTARGGTGDDYVVGGNGDDVRLAGNGGSDFVAGGAGNDALISGGPRPDEIFGGTGNDLLKGLGGADRIFGDAGDDELRGGEQPDLIDGGAGTDLCNGGAKDDRSSNCETTQAVESAVPDPLDFTSTQVVTCPIDAPAQFLAAVTCTRVTVPEDDTNPGNGRTVSIMVAYVDNGNDAFGPIVNLTGGPGGSDLDSAPFFQSAANGFPYDIVFVDQRGIGDSTPSLDCPEVDNVFTALGAANAEIACAERLSAAGVDHAMFNTEQVADDFELIRRSLGINEWNLWGVSYGTRLGLTIARDHPEGVRSLIVDAVLPLEVDTLGALQPNFGAALDRLFAACAAEIGCASAYGDLDPLLATAITTLDNNPYTAFGFDAQGNSVPVVVDGETFRSFLFSVMYSTQLIPEVPRWISLASQGDVVELTQFFTPAGGGGGGEFSEGMLRSVMCQDERVSLNLGGFSNVWTYLCPSFTDASDPWFDKTAAANGIPTLSLSGRFDPITPPNWGQQVADSMDNAFFAEFSVQGHGASGPCFATMFATFIESGGTQADVSCADEGLPNFTTPTNPSSFSTERSDRPASWDEYRPEQERRVLPSLGLTLGD